MNRLLTSLRNGDWLTPRRMRNYACISAAVLSTVLIWDVWTHTRFGLVNAEGEQLGRDFVNYWAGGKLALQGRAATAYRVDDYNAFQRGLTANNALLKLYSYPPPAMLLTLPLGFLPFIAGLAMWTLGGWALLTRMLAPFGWPTAAIAWLATPAFFLNALSGQNGAFSAATGRGRVAARSAARAVGRPLRIALLQAALGDADTGGAVAGGRWRAVLASAATAALIVVVSVMLLGWAPWTGFMHNVPLHRHGLEEMAVNWKRIPTIYTACCLPAPPIHWPTPRRPSRPCWPPHVYCRCGGIGPHAAQGRCAGCGNVPGYALRLGLRPGRTPVRGGLVLGPRRRHRLAALGTDAAGRLIGFTGGDAASCRAVAPSAWPAGSLGGACDARAPRQ